MVGVKDRALSGRGVTSYGSMDVLSCAEDECNRRGSLRPGQEKWVLVKPDGGWGWFVVFGAAISKMTSQSLISVFGLLFMQRLPELGIDTKGVSVMVSVQLTILNLSGLVTGPILKRFTYRQLAFTGATLVTLGLFLTGYANSLLTFICTYSALTGLGIGFLVPSTFVAINSYFTTWRARAVGLAVTGTGIGQMLLPLLVRYLLEEYNFRGTVMILAALSAHSFVGGALYQPVKRHMKRQRAPEEEEMIKEGVENGEPGKEEANDSGVGSVSDSPARKKHCKWLPGILALMDWNLLRRLSFLNLLICLGVVYTANILFSTLLPFFLESAGHPGTDIAICMSVLSGADIVGRLVLPTVTDLFKLRTKSVLFLGAGFSAIFRTALVWYNTSSGQFYPTLALAAACGIVRAGIICNFNLCVSDEVSPEKLPSALGLHMVFKGLSVLAFAPLIGFVRDYTGSYSLSLHITNGLFLALPFLVWLIEHIALKRSHG